MSINMQCSKCSGMLELGFLIDREHNSFEGATKWASGTPQDHIWRWSSVRKGAQKLAVATYRCSKCGYLESYAHDAV